MKLSSGTTLEAGDRVPRASYTLRSDDVTLTLSFEGNWTADGRAPSAEALFNEMNPVAPSASLLVLQVEDAALWDSLLPARLLQCIYWARGAGLSTDYSTLPGELGELIRIATTVEPQAPSVAHPVTLRRRLQWGIRSVLGAVADFLEFIGGVASALVKMLSGRSNTRLRDVVYFIEQAGPNALGIVTLISLLVGMILAYMGALQLRQFGAQIYVANLVGIGMVREMAALMTAIIMAGRTGAAYAAQLGTMQTNEEIDAIETLGMSAMEFLVIPRMLALVFVMPLLNIFSDALGILGGAAVAMGMDVSPLQYLHQIQTSVSWNDIAAGLIKSLVFAVLIAIAGCQAGLRCGRSSAAVGQATTSAVVRAIIYIIMADSLLNVVYDKLEF